jgi:hypothetical protein
MKVAFQALLTLAIAAGFSTALAGKGATSRITISGGNLASSIEIRDPAIVKPFQIWAGPGTRSCAGDRSNCVEGTEGFIVDWSAGTLPARPRGCNATRFLFSSWTNASPVRHVPRSSRTSYRMSTTPRAPRDSCTCQAMAIRGTRLIRDPSIAAWRATGSVRPELGRTPSCH